MKRRGTEDLMRRKAVLSVIAGVAVWFVQPRGGGIDAFLPSPHRGASSKTGALRGGARLQRRAALEQQLEAPPARRQIEFKTKEPRTADEMMEEMLYPAEDMWKVSTDGTVLKEDYPGANGPISVFWAVVQPAVSLAFCIIGSSIWFGVNLVDLTPITKEWLWFLRVQPDMTWIPNGIFLCIYGFPGFFIFGPLQWWLIGEDRGRGVATFDKITGFFTVVRDNEMIERHKLKDIKCVKMVWTELFGDTREVYVITSQGDQISFMSYHKDYPKRVLEKRASVLANFLGCDLDIDDIPQS